MNFIRNPSGFFNNKESDMKLHMPQTSPLIAPILQPNLDFKRGHMTMVHRLIQASSYNDSNS
jgi:hypothetical protein